MTHGSLFCATVCNILLTTGVQSAGGVVRESRVVCRQHLPLQSGTSVGEHCYALSWLNLAVLFSNFLFVVRNC